MSKNVSSGTRNRKKVSSKIKESICLGVEKNMAENRT
jgi:hypothetical protein